MKKELQVFILVLWCVIYVLFFLFLFDGRVCQFHVVVRGGLAVGFLETRWQGPLNSLAVMIIIDLLVRRYHHIPKVTHFNCVVENLINVYQLERLPVDFTFEINDNVYGFFL